MLSVVGNVSIAEIDPESEGRRSLLVDVEERPLTTVTVGLGAGDRDFGYVRLSGEVTRRNLGGRDRSITQFFSGSARGLRLLTTYREPYVFGRRQDLFITGFREEEEKESFSFARYGLLLETVRRLTKSWSVIGRYTMQKTDNDLDPLLVIDREFEKATISGPALSIVNDTRDDPLDPRRGHFVGGDAQLSHRALGGESFLKGFVQGSLYHRLRPRVLFAGNARLGLAGTFEGEPEGLPLTERFFAGGDYSIRGFPLDFVGPLDLSEEAQPRLLPVGGNALLLGSAELRFDFGRYVGLAAFTDMGNVFPLVSDLDLENLRYTAGLGLRYRSAFGPIRVDWGYKLNRREKESASRFHFTVGHAF
jgi:outer membrane protein insertion porin family